MDTEGEWGLPIMPRKLKLTKERQDAIVSKIKNGVWLATAAVASGISEPTFWRWMRAGEPHPDPETGRIIYPSKQFRDFRDSVTRARAEAETIVTLHIIKQSQGGNSRASMFFLERSFRDRWGKVEKVVTETTPVDDTPTFDPSLLSVDELATLERLLTKGKPGPPLPGR